jgi:phosphate:Na+ symporter
VERSVQVTAGESRLTELTQRIQSNPMVRLERGTRAIASGVVFLEYVNHMERVGDHLVNIAKRAKKIVRVTR